MTTEFLAFSTERGTTSPLPGRTTGSPACAQGTVVLCADRWAEALEAGVAPPVNLAATHAVTLEWVTLEDLRRHAAG